MDETPEDTVAEALSDWRAAEREVMAAREALEAALVSEEQTRLRYREAEARSAAPGLPPIHEPT